MSTVIGNREFPISIPTAPKFVDRMLWNSNLRNMSGDHHMPNMVKIGLMALTGRFIREYPVHYQIACTLCSLYASFTAGSIVRYTDPCGFGQGCAISKSWCLEIFMHRIFVENLSQKWRRLVHNATVTPTVEQQAGVRWLYTCSPSCIISPR